MKKCIILMLAYLLLSCDLYSQDADTDQNSSNKENFPEMEKMPQNTDSEEKEKTADADLTRGKNIQSIVRKQESSVKPYESEKYYESYPYLHNSSKNKTGSLFFSLRKNIENWNAFIELNYLEIRKADLSRENVYCYYYLCSNLGRKVGNYFRANTETNLLKKFYKDRLSLGGGLRHIKSNLDYNYSYAFNVRSGSNFLGPQISFRFQTPDLWGFYISGKIDYFYLQGILNYRSGEMYSRIYEGAFGRGIDSKVRAYSLGSEIGFALNWKLNETVEFAYGLEVFDARIKPKTKEKVSSIPYDFWSDLSNNITARQLGDSYPDKIKSIYLQVMLRM